MHNIPMDLLVLSVVVSAAIAESHSTVTNGQGVLPHLDILVAGDITTSLKQHRFKHVKPFVENLCEKLGMNGELRLVFMGGNILVLDPFNGSTCNVELKAWDHLLQRIHQSWERRNKNYTVGLNYAGLFAETKIQFQQRRAKEKGEPVLILIAHLREGCMVNHCLNTNACCKACHECNTSKCEIAVPVNETHKQKVKLFVSHEPEDLKNSGARIITIGVGSETEPIRLQCWASENSFISLGDYTELPHEGFSRVSTLLDTITVSSTSSPVYTVSGIFTKSGLATSVNGSQVYTTSTARTEIEAILAWGFVTACVGLAVIMASLFIVLAILILRRRKHEHGTGVSHGHHSYTTAEATVAAERHSAAPSSGPIPWVESRSRNGRSNFLNTIDSTAKANRTTESATEPPDGRVRKPTEQTMLAKAKQRAKECYKMSPTQTGEHPLFPSEKRNVHFASKMVKIWSYTDSDSEIK